MRNRLADCEYPKATTYAVAGGRLDVLAPEVGRWIGFYEDDHTRTLTTALRALPLEMEKWIALGQKRRSAPHHRTPAPRG